MKLMPVTLKFDASKLKALDYYLPKNGSTIEGEMTEYLEKIYDERVPQDVKDFIQFQSASEEAPVKKKSSGDRNKKKIKNLPIASNESTHRGEQQ